MKSYGVKEKHIGSSVSEILRTTQTDRHTHKDRHPVTFIEGYCLLFIVLCFQLIISQITISLHSRLMIIYTIQFFYNLKKIRQLRIKIVLGQSVSKISHVTS